MLNLNTAILTQVVDQAMRDAADHPRWLNAISRAVVELLSNPWIEREPTHTYGLIIGSPSGKCYAANGVCQCQAFAHNRPCWHRAAARLVRLHDERQAAARPPFCFYCSGATDHDTDHCPRLDDEQHAAQDHRAAINARQAAAQAAMDDLFA